jgi:hypothetical protein
MAESTLAVTRTIILRALGRYLSVSRTVADWHADDATDIDDYVEFGESQFYWPPPLANEPVSHVWSFLNQTFKLGLVSGQWEYDLPEGCSGFEGGKLHFVQGDNAYHEVELTTPEEIYKLRSLENYDNYAYPYYAAVNAIPSEHDRGQRFSLMFWPTPDSEKTLIGRYVVDPSAIASATPYPMGGVKHGSTLIASCLAAAELMHNDIHNGPWHTKFMERLTTSVKLDRALHGPKTFGIMHDQSMPGLKMPARWHYGNLVDAPTA